MSEFPMPTPLRAEGASIKALDHGKWYAIGSVNGSRLADEARPDFAGRIVACVNACNGIPTEALSLGGPFAAMRAVICERNDLQAQRDELLAALELIDSNAAESAEWIRARIRPAIAKAKGG